MSAEEMKIRGELEMDVERDLEEEIKDGIYCLALRLHRLYQHKKVRRESETGSEDVVSEVNITIKMNGETKVEIKEAKKETPRVSSPRVSRLDYMQGFTSRKSKKFNWATSLRGPPGPVTTSRSSKAVEKKLVELEWKY